MLSIGASVGRGGVFINFDDVVGSKVDITNRYAGLGVTLHAISNPFPLSGAFPAPATLPPTLGGVITWTSGFPGALSPPQVAVAAATAQTGNEGDGGILISFAFDVSAVSLVGNDAGATTGDDEHVTLTAYDAAGNRIGQTFTTAKLTTFPDRVAASINLPSMRYVAFNYTDTQYGFYAIDNLNFTQVPEPAGALSAAVGLMVLITARARSSR